jgi:hypothetical protein
LSRIISDILGAPEPNFSHLLQEWERKAGRPSHDVRLVSDMSTRAKEALSSLGFDQDDTTAHELYFALQHKVQNDNIRIARAIGVEDSDDPVEMLQKVVAWVEKQDIYRDVWVLKQSVIKTFLQKQPPKILMKTLGLRSAESMLKRNSPCELLPLAYTLEKQEWSQKFRQGFKKLKVSDFQVKPISIYVCSDERVQKLKKAGYPVTRIVTPCYELGSMSLIPPQSRFTGDVLAITVSLLETIADLRRHSAYYRVLSVRRDFGNRFYEVCDHGITQASRLLAHMGWNSVHKHLIGNRDFFDEVEQPHLMHEDMYTSSTTQVLSHADPGLAFWDGLEYVFFAPRNQYPVSLHLVDVITNASNRYPYQQATTHYGKARLWDELWSRYLANETLSEQTVGQFFGEENFQ